MAAAESTYLKVVADKSHDFRTGTITAAARDAAVATAWTSYQNTAIQQRNTYRVNQAGAAATYRNAVAGAEKSQVTTVTTQNETLTNALQDAQATLAQQRWNAWLTGAKSLVNLNAESSISRAQSLVTAIGQLVNEQPVTWSGSGSGSGSGVGYSAPNPFWAALAQKAQLSSDYITATKNAERLYYGRSPWSDNVNGAIIEHQFGTRGVLDARRDYEVGIGARKGSTKRCQERMALS